MIYDLYVGQGNNTDALDHLTIRDTKSYCLNAFGGYTLLRGEGGWRNFHDHATFEGTDVEEPVHIWRIFSHDRAAVRRFRDWLQTTYRQLEVPCLEQTMKEVLA